jgi:hypothetical protein
MGELSTRECFFGSCNERSLHRRKRIVALELVTVVISAASDRAVQYFMRWRRLLFALALGALGLAALVYTVDYVVFRIRRASNRSPYGSVTVQRFDAVLKKNGKTEYLFDPPQSQTCVNALFPHEGFASCWYLNRHREQGTNI